MLLYNFILLQILIASIVVSLDGWAVNDKFSNIKFFNF